MSKNEIKIESVTNLGNRFEINFECSKCINSFFKSKCFFCEYDSDISNVNTDILLIPFVANILPLLWLFDIQLKLDTLDKQFFESIEHIKSGYVKMFPMFTFANNVVNVERLVDNFSKNNKKELCLFSGGIDAYNTLINNYNENLELFTIIGADIPLKDPKSIRLFKEQIHTASTLFNIKENYCFSNFKDIINHDELNEKVKLCKDNYWHAFQHGIGIISLTAPIAKILGVNKIYIASSFSNKELNNTPNLTIASHPYIDNNFKACGFITIYDGIEYDRIDKVENICNYAKLNKISIPVHVCWQNASAENCCHCEKCYRTIMQICALGIIDPKQLGFNLSQKTFSDFKKFIKYKAAPGQCRMVFYKEMQEKINQNSLYYNEIKWFKKYKLSGLQKSIKRKVYNNLRRVYRKLKSIFRKNK